MDKNEYVKNLLKRLSEVKISESARKRFVSGLDKIGQKKEAFGFGSLKDRIYYGTQESLGRIRNTLVEPIPVLARAVISVGIVFLVCAYFFFPSAPKIHDIKGTVKIFDSSRNMWVFARNNQRIDRRDIVKTFQDGRVDITLQGVYSMRLKRNSEVELKETTSRAIKRDIAFKTKKGRILAYYEGMGAKKKGFKIETDELIASALGTNFMVEAMPKFHKSWVGVLDGVVRVTSLDIPRSADPKYATVSVESGHKTEVIKGEIPLKPQRIMESEWLQLKELYSVGKKPQVALLISTGRTRVRELLSSPILYVSDTEPSVLPQRLTKLVDIFNQAVLEKSRTKHKEAIKKLERIVEDYPNKKYDVQFLLFIGSYHNYLGEYNKAVETFQKVISQYPDSKLASLAQCAIGIIYEENLKDQKEAIKAYQKVISFYPHSPEANEALSGLDRLSQ